MQVPATSYSTQTQTQNNSAATAASLNYNSFLRLLVAEMKNQDPTKPNDATQYMAQLASFSNVEQAIQTNSKLDAILTSSALSQADGLIGHTLTSADGAISGTVKSLTINSNGVIATLQNGSQIPLGPGVVVS